MTTAQEHADSLEDHTNPKHAQFFKFEHLPEGRLRDTSEAFDIFLAGLNEVTPESAEKSAGVRKLLEAKDCFVRANL